MANISRIRVGFSGAQGLPGVSTFYALDAATAVPALRTFFGAIAQFFPNDVAIDVEHTGDIINESNGQLNATWAAAQPAALQGGSPATYAAPVGFLVRWETGVFIGGRRVRGRTFLVPITSTSFVDDGTPAFGSQQAIVTAATTMLAAVPGNFLVWHRPTAPQANDGTGVAISSAACPDLAAVLRSRRD